MSSESPADVQSLMQAALDHHGAGRLREAELIYRRVLEAAPGEANAWHGLGMIAHACGAWDDAAELVGHAAKLQPAVWAYRHDLAEVCRTKGLLDGAAAEYEAALRLDAGQAKTHVGLGAVREAQGRRGEAIEHYRRAVALDPDFGAAHYGLGVALAAQGAADEALPHARRAVELDPDDADAREQLGGLLARRGDDTGAVEHFRAAAAAHPKLNCQLGAALARQGQLLEAVDCFARAIAAAPDFGDAYNLAGRALFELGRRDEGIDCFRKAAELMPDRADVRHDLGVALESAGLTAEAAEAFAQAGRLGMADEANLHLAAMGRADAPAAAPAPYIRRLFDDYAARFDQSLVDGLKYQTPDLLAAAIRTAAGLSPDATARWGVIDLGCGTGLLGALLRPLAARLIGVDLSPRMIELAQARGIYDRLDVGDLVDALTAEPARYDLVAAADVFVYLGDLAPVFRAAVAALRPGGLFAFSVEAGEGDAYRLGATRRYAHGAAYVRRIAKESGFAECSATQATLRLEKGEEVAGLLFVMRRPITSKSVIPTGGQ